jgi:hypothetical protein
VECAKPDDAGYAWEPYGYGYTEGLYPDGLSIQNSGYLRVSVSPTETKVEYVRSYLPGDGTNGTVAHSFTVPSSPTAVTLASFGAEAQPMLPSVTQNWSTVSEVDVLGFNLYRAEALAGEKKLLNTGLIPAKHPGELIGDHYSFEDTQVISGRMFTYWVEAVKQFGPAELSSPQMVLIGYKVSLPTIRRK